ncbi:Crp/Fnr family transcriptional regulator [Campylobacter sp. US33a]|uniref:Crp/Fnr family transcriptional regulator n=1 Tax=Campylobacter sp. US33a TaxID=2498120 RepID=UPI0010671C7A|nr:Crp/Fnr family transcriptional regulator [Campylobacter sp. US33a]TEY00921.1 Crp/Fnr family transcriptional regulator [Campylobacter sp. US33a]
MTKEELIDNFFKKFKLANEDLEEIKSNAYFKNLSKGTQLASADDCLGFVIMAYGTLRAYIISSNAKEITIFKLIKNEECVICSNCALNSINYNIILESNEDSQILIIPTKIYTKIRNKYQSINDYTLNIISKRFSDLISVLEHALFTPLIERIRIFLKENSQNNKITLTHEEIANHLGSAREAISRILKEMEKQGEISLGRKEITLLK